MGVGLEEERECEHQQMLKSTDLAEDIRKILDDTNNIDLS